jgi:phosphoribosylformylglycinamidine cyclo-ligase
VGVRGCCYNREGTIITEMIAAELGEEAISKTGGDLSTEEKGMDYLGAGVDNEREEVGLSGVRKWLDKTLRFREGLIGAPAMGTKFYANILDLGNGQGLAISTDGVGTKVLVARMMGKYDTVGIDCMAMNVNDILCVGAEPVAFIDYLAVAEADPEVMEQIAKGLHDAAKVAGVSVPGGETAQVPELLSDDGLPGVPFDLAGMAIGTVQLDKAISGQDIAPQDVIIGLQSSGLHSNGLTLARKVLFEKGRLGVDSSVRELGRSVGEELLEPTLIYVPQVLDMLKSGLQVKGLAHITGDGLMNLARLETNVGFVVNNLPEPQPIFSLIQSLGNISDEEMFRVFNMGVGFCVITSEGDADKVLDICRKHDTSAQVIGHTTRESAKEVHIESKGLMGKGRRFSKF